jgi:ParB-like nuclease domain
MTRPPEFALVPIGKLLSHEEVEEENVAEIVRELERTQVFADPIWVARDSLVILNGHHRVEALRQLKAARVPVWLLDYDSDLVSLEPWRPGLPITKSEVVRRAQAGRPFPPKTTRHGVRVPLDPHPTPLAELVARRRGSHQPAASGRSGRRGAGVSRSG